MSTSLIFVAIGILLLVFVVRVAKGNAQVVTQPEELPNHVIPLDLVAFGNLISADEQQMLARTLDRRRFHMVQRSRRRATLAYVTVAAHNAAVLLRFADALRSSADPKLANSAAELAAIAIRTRLICLLLMVKLRMPLGLQVGTLNFVSCYERASFALRQVVALQQPRVASRVCSSFIVAS